MTKPLTEPEIETMYELLGKLHVPLVDVPEKGLSYIKERLALCRAMQDQSQTLRLQTGQALSYVRQQRIYVKHSIPLAASDQEKDQLKGRLSELEQQDVSHAMLHKLVNAQAAALNQTARDIKLLGDVMVKQLKLGEMTDVNPTDSPEVLQPKTVADMAAELPASAFAVTTNEVVEDEESAGEDLSALFGGTVVPRTDTPLPMPVSTAVSSGAVVSFDDPLPGVVEPDPIQLSDRTSVPIEALFEELTGGHQHAPL